MQTDDDARRIIAIGAPPSRVHVTKNLKYDIPVARVSGEHKSTLLRKYCLPSGVPVVTAGSTHRGEDEIVLDVFRTLLREGREPVLVLAPRHPERADEVLKIAEQNGLRCVRRSQLEGQSVQLHAGEVLLLDTVGELLDIYSISDLVFVGGSMVPVGGHNLLEPASLAVPVIFGSHMNNFREIAALILLQQGGIQVEDSASLTETLRQLLDNPAERLRLGENGARILMDNCGSTERNLEIIASLLSGAGSGLHLPESPPSSDSGKHGAV